MRPVHDDQDQVKKNAPQPIHQPTGDSTTEQPGQPEALMRSLQRSAGNAAVNELMTADSGRAVAGSAGERLPPNVRRQAERKLAADLGDARVHADGAAHEFATALGAEAVTLGQDVYFRDGTPDANTSRGQKLYVHELTHVVQADKAPRAGAMAVSHPQSAAEHEAATVSATGWTGGGAVPEATARGGVAHRHVAPGEEKVEEATEASDVEATGKEDVAGPAQGGQPGPTGSQTRQPGGTAPAAANPLRDLYRVVVDQRIIAAHAALTGTKPAPRVAVRELKTARDSIRALNAAYKGNNPLLAARLAALGNGITSVIVAIGPLLGEKNDIETIARHTNQLLSSAAEVGSSLG